MIHIYTDGGDKKECRRADNLDREMSQLFIPAKFPFVFFSLFVFF